MIQPTVLVTGGAGYIGSHVVAQLGLYGYRVVILDNLVNGHADSVLHGRLVGLDINNVPALHDLFCQYHFDAVIHFAGLIEAGVSVREPLSFYRANVTGSLALLEAMQHAGVNRLVFSSTAAVYGSPKTVPIPEDAPKSPVNPYGKTKLVIEEAIVDCRMAWGLDAVCLRYFNAAGADPAGRLGERHDPESHLIPLVLAAVAGERSHAAIYGDDYPTPDGTCVRDYIHVTDLAAAHIIALEGLLAGTPLPPAINLGLGRGFSVREVIESVRRVTGCPLEVRVEPRRPGDPPALVADPTLARETLGWVAKYTELDTMVAHAWQFKQRRWGEGR